LSGLDGAGYLGVAMPPGVAVGPPMLVEALWQAQAPSTRLRGVHPLMGVAAAVSRRGEMATSGRYGGNLGVGWAGTMFGGVAMGWAMTTR
jgi:hypothetical protein